MSKCNKDHNDQFIIQFEKKKCDKNSHSQGNIAEGNENHNANRSKRNKYTHYPLQNVCDLVRFSRYSLHTDAWESYSWIQCMQKHAEKLGIGTCFIVSTPMLESDFQTKKFVYFEREKATANRKLLIWFLNTKGFEQITLLLQQIQMHLLEYAQLALKSDPVGMHCVAFVPEAQRSIYIHIYICCAYEKREKNYDILSICEISSCTATFGRFPFGFRMNTVHIDRHTY